MWDSQTGEESWIYNNPLYVVYSAYLMRNGDSMTIRLATAMDLCGIMKYDSHIPRKQLEECVSRGLVYVLCDGAEVVGVLRYNLFWQTIPFLDLLYMDEFYWGKGFGTQMMGDWEASMLSRGYPYVMLSTQEDETAKYFYEKAGYCRIGSFLPPNQEAEEIMYLKELKR